MRVTATATDPVSIDLSDNGATVGPEFILNRITNDPAALDAIGAVRFDGRNLSNAQVVYGKLLAAILDPTAASEDSDVRVQNMVAGSLATRMIVDGGLQAALVGSVPALNVRPIASQADYLKVTGGNGTTHPVPGPSTAAQPNVNVAILGKGTGSVLLNKTVVDLVTAGQYFDPSGQFGVCRLDGSLGLWNRHSSDGDMHVFRRNNVTVGSISVTTTNTAYNTFRPATET